MLDEFMKTAHSQSKLDWLILELAWYKKISEVKRKIVLLCKQLAVLEEKEKSKEDRDALKRLSSEIPTDRNSVRICACAMYLIPRQIYCIFGTITYATQISGKSVPKLLQKERQRSQEARAWAGTRGSGS